MKSRYKRHVRCEEFREIQESPAERQERGNQTSARSRVDNVQTNRAGHISTAQRLRKRQNTQMDKQLMSAAPAWLLKLTLAQSTPCEE